MPDDNKPRPPSTELAELAKSKDDPTVHAPRHVMHRPDDGDAFLPDPSRNGGHISAGDAEYFGEEFVASATGGEPLHMDALDEVVEEEEGGPFLELDAEANPEADLESLPTWTPATNPRRSLSR